MAKDKRRVAQNQAKKKERQAARKKLLNKQSTGGGRFAKMGCTRRELENSPIHAVYVGDSVFTLGIGYAIVARRLPDGQIAAGVFLVDVYCLGIKDAVLVVKPEYEFDNGIKTNFAIKDLKPVAPAYARKLIEDSITYARDLGFEPHPDYRDASVVLGDIDPAACTEQFTFGHEGMPFYMSGSHHSQLKARQIIEHLTKRFGPDGFHYLVGIEHPDTDDAFDG
jgi:hypothetical protein